LRSKSGWGGPHDLAPEILERAVAIAQQIIVPNAKHTIATRFQPSRSLKIVGDGAALTVLAAVEFDYAFRGGTVEIHDVRANRLLSPESQRQESLVAQVCP
jgi:hypothetical protein